MLLTVNNKGKPKHMLETMSHGPQLNVWGCFSSNCVELLKRIKGSMDSKLYQASIVKDIDVVAKCLVFPEKNFVFQQNLSLHIELRALTIT